MNLFNSLLQDELIFLNQVKMSDIEGSYSEWFNNINVVKFNSHGRWPMTSENLKEYIQKTNASKNRLVLAIRLKENHKHIGNISLQNINWIDSNAELACIIGEVSCQGKGIMTRAGKLIISHGFNQLNLHRIYCGTSAENIGMIRVAEKLGMKKEGERHEALFKNGGYRNIVEFGILKSNYISIKSY